MHLLVTVGTTLFEELIIKLDDKKIYKLLKDFGFTNLFF
jgi:hypothetical protein